MIIGNLIHNFKNIFGTGGDIRLYFAPGRVNLIGEHTDYNGGHVFPCALDIGTYGVIRLRNDKLLRFYSMNFEQSGIMESSLNELEYSVEADWTNYPKGMIWTFAKHGMPISSGMDVLFYGTIPNGSGLSSSSSIDMLMGYMIKDMSGYDITGEMLAKLGQDAENNYNNVNCGIMDQFAIVMGKADNAIFLDTSTLTYQYAPLPMDGIKIIIANTGRQRKLANSKYNERRSQCHDALTKIQSAMQSQGKTPIHSLGELSPDTLTIYKNAINDDILYRRAKHAVSENYRTIEAVKALREKDLDKFGKLMTESHHSLRDDYEVTGIELDTLVNAALKIPGVLGSRMTGAGFGGCTVSLVKESSVDEFIRQTGAEYQSATGLHAEFYVVSVGDGVRRLI